MHGCTAKKLIILMEKIAAEMDIVGKHEFQHFDIYFGEEVPKRNETIKQHLKNNL